VVDGTGRPPGGGQPSTLTELVEALTTLPALDPVERIRVLRGLQAVTRTIYADAAALAMLEATSGPGPRYRQVDLAAELDIHKNKVSAGRRRAATLKAPRG
jgi:predicted anti-sigma-YlaC factor YlaD